MIAEKMLLVEYEIELIINKQLHDENHITYDVYKKTSEMILKDIEEQTRKIEQLNTS